MLASCVVKECRHSQKVFLHSQFQSRIFKAWKSVSGNALADDPRTTDPSSSSSAMQQAQNQQTREGGGQAQEGECLRRASVGCRERLCAFVLRR